MAVKKPTARSRIGKMSRERRGEPVAIERMQRRFGSGEFIGPKGTVAVEKVIQSFGISRAQLASTAGLSSETFYRKNRLAALKTQTRLKEMLEIVSRIADWAGGRDQAMAWYRAQPIPAFGGRTAESLVKDGKAGDVRDYLDHVALGGFA
jgi:uncharacterized protein (DUF2384 family)